jgi:predicted O-linked N-acetylglucosamine transferase (SPINDLY family)
MKKPQLITAGIAVFMTLTLYAVTQDNIFGHHTKTPTASKEADSHEGHNHPPGEHPGETKFSVDSILHHAKENLTAEQLTRISFLESSITRGNVAEQKMHVFHQLARFWRDTARIFEPFAWYTAEAARLENSEKSLTFAAHLFLKDLRFEKSAVLQHWKAEQAKDLFERSLKLNPNNDSSQVALGATLLFGGISNNPMDGIMKIRQVAEQDSTNIYAQMTLGEASMMSGQLDKAIERFKKVTQLQPNNLEAILYLADVYERKGEKKEAAAWYQRSLPFIQIPELKKEVEKRVAQLLK